MHLSELKSLHVSQLLEMAIANEVDGANRLRKQELVFALLKNCAKKGEPIFGDGALEVLPDGFGFLRSPDISYLAGTDDIYVSPRRSGASTCAPATPSRARSVPRRKASATSPLVKLDKVNTRRRCLKAQDLFENLTPLHPPSA